MYIYNNGFEYGNWIMNVEKYKTGCVKRSPRNEEFQLDFLENISSKLRMTSSCLHMCALRPLLLFWDQTF